MMPSVTSHVWLGMWCISTFSFCTVLPSVKPYSMTTQWKCSAQDFGSQNCQETCIQVLKEMVQMGFTCVCFILFSSTPGPIPMMIGAELFRQGPRPRAMSLAGFTNWLFTMIVALTFEIIQVSLNSLRQKYMYFCLRLIEKIHKPGTKLMMEVLAVKSKKQFSISSFMCFDFLWVFVFTPQDETTLISWAKLADSGCLRFLPSATVPSINTGGKMQTTAVSSNFITDSCAAPGIIHCACHGLFCLILLVAIQPWFSECVLASCSSQKVASFPQSLSEIASVGAFARVSCLQVVQARKGTCFDMQKAACACTTLIKSDVNKGFTM